MENLKYFLYARKSSEAEDRQVLSIDAQRDELKKIAAQLNITIVEILDEAKSAKKPGRTIFNNMLDRIYKGEAQGIICWKLDRLARNPIDGGQIQWMLQQGIIQHIQTFEKGYYPTDNVILMAMELGVANQFIRDLSTNVKRGLRKRTEQGLTSGVAPIGYINVTNPKTAINTIEKDPERFDMIRKAWDLMLTGSYTVPQILEIANNEWAFKTLRRQKTGGGPISRSTLYKVFSNPFYYGVFESPKNSGNWVNGTYDAMISKEEFDRVQILLGRKGKPAPHTRTFAFTGLIQCGECNAQVTAEAKNQIICTSCKFKFGYENKNACPKCETGIEQMNKPTILNYVYYHCTKRKNTDCTQGSIKVEELENQLADRLSNIQINQEYLDWALSHLKATNQLEANKNEIIIKSQQEAYTKISKRLEELLEMRLNKEIDTEEFIEQKSKLSKQKQQYLELLNQTNSIQDDRVERSEKFLQFCHHAAYWFEDAKQKKDLQRQREIITSLGSNLTLKDRILNVNWIEPFAILQDGLISVPEATVMLEPTKALVNKTQNRLTAVSNPIWLPLLDTFRTVNWASMRQELRLMPAFSL